MATARSMLLLIILFCITLCSANSQEGNGNLIVMLRSTSTDADMEEVLKICDCINSEGFHRLDIIKGFSATISEENIKAILTHPAVDHIEHDQEVTIDRRSTTSFIEVQPLYSLNQYWFGASFNKLASPLALVEVIDSSNDAQWQTTTLADWGAFFTPAKPFKAPLSIRLTSQSGQVLTLVDVITSIATPSTNPPPVIQTRVQFPTATTPPTHIPPTSPARPTPKAPQLPGALPSLLPATPKPDVTLQVHVHSDSSPNWFAVDVRGSSSAISAVDVQDATSAKWEPLTLTSFQYWVYQSTGTLTAPLTVRITSQSGRSISLSLSAIVAGELLDSHTNF